MELTAEILVRLSRGECPSWPDCHCNFYLGTWGERLQDEDRSWPRGDLRIAEDMIFIKLLCVMDRCPEPKLRVWAEEQLRKPFWNRQWARAIRQY
jgi:hypothetical protein